MISGLLTNGKVSTIFIAKGITPSLVDVFMNRSHQVVADFEGHKLEGQQNDRGGRGQWSGKTFGPQGGV